MNTTYVLHGGRTSKESPKNDKFYRLFTQLVEKDHVNILLCYWSREKSRWDELSKKDQVAIGRQTPKNVSFSIAEDPDDLFTKLVSHDVLFVAGGDAERIEPFLPQLNNLHEKLNNKVYIGSSMGAFIVSTNYVLSFEDQDSTNVHHGLGILPISTLCHWDIETKKKEKINMLKQKAPEIPILALDEQELTMFIH